MSIIIIMILILKTLLHNVYKIINFQYPTYVYQFLIFLIITKIECWPVFEQDPNSLIAKNGTTRRAKRCKSSLYLRMTTKRKLGKYNRWTFRRGKRNCVAIKVIAGTTQCVRSDETYLRRSNIKDKYQFYHNKKRNKRTTIYLACPHPRRQATIPRQKSLRKGRVVCLPRHCR